MKLIFSFVLFSIMFIGGSFVNESQAVEPKSVAKVVELMYSKSTKGVIARKTYEDGGVQIVFVSGSRRYTFYHSGDEKLNFLSVWVRPNGTGGQEKYETFTDHDLDGQVDFGITGKDEHDSIRKHYNSGKDGLDKKGEQFREYWQQQYDRAISDALRRLKEK